MKLTNFSFIILLCFFVISCSTVQVSSDYNKTLNFLTYKTYSFEEKNLDKLKINDLNKAELIKAVDIQLASKGFRKVATDSDLLVNLLTSSKEEISVYKDDWGYGPYQPYGPYGYYDQFNDFGYYNDFNSQSEENISTFKVGKIIIDIIDNKKHSLIWQGVGSDLNLANTSTVSKEIPKAVQEILSKFPPQQKK